MKFKQMLFKGKTVFVEVDETGQVKLDKGRARMKYRLEDERVYSPGQANLSDADSALLFDGPEGQVVGPKKPVAKKKKKATKPQAPAEPIPDGAIIAYTDGACSGNPGPAGLGYLIDFPDGQSVQKGEPLGHGTNNIAELTAIYRVLQLVEDRAKPLVIHTDSTYSIGVLTQGWKAKANVELIAQIKTLVVKFPNLELRKVKGHAGIPENELVDDLARISSERQEPLDSV